MSDTNCDKFYNRYSDAGFYFPSSVLSSYALSLHTKPFVILSGISGTGKTKIAQLFHTPANPSKKIEAAEEAGRNTSKLIIKVPAIFDRFNFPQELLPEILSQAELDAFNEKAEKFRLRGDGGNFSETYVLDIEDAHGGFQVAIYGQRASSPLIRGRFYKSSRDAESPEYDARTHLKKHYSVGDVLGLESIGERKFKIVSLNEETVIAEKQEQDLNTIERQCFIPVRSDWTDNSELFGFYNLIEQKYHVPQFLDFLLTAINNPEYPFFVLLDEMNLSKVEHYFSDILSCLESRVETRDGLHQEKVVLYSGSSQLYTDSDDYEHIPNAIEIPTNLFITGTVNIDESTYMFSPKVLDRANVIQFNEVDLESYGGGEVEKGDSFKLKKFPDFMDTKLALKKHYGDLSDDIKNHLVAVNNILKSYHLHFGYRTANEVALYILSAMNHIDDGMDTQLQALDIQFIQKIFPKLNGGYAALEAPLKEVLLYLSVEKDIANIVADKTSFPKTINKLQKMYNTLSVSGYSSFID